MSYDNSCNLTYMTNGSQDAIAAIEQALIALRRDQLRRGFRGPGGARGGPGFERGGPPRGDRRPPGGDSPPPEWMHDHHGHHDRSLGGAARFRLLDALVAAAARGERMGISEIADAIHVDQPRASRLVNDAVERGLITRRTDERDARRSVVELSDAGRALLETSRATRRSAVTEALDGFTPDEIATFSALLARFVASWPR